MGDMKAVWEFLKVLAIVLGVVSGFVAELVCAAILAIFVNPILGILVGAVMTSFTLWWVIKKAPKIPE